MKKKLLVALMTLCLVTSLVACGKDDTGNKDEGSSQTTTEETQDKDETKEDSASDETTDNEKEQEDEKKDTETTENNDKQSDNQELTVDADYANLTESQGFVFESNGDGTCTLMEIGDCTDSDIVIPEKSPAGDMVTMIEEYAFYNAEDVNSIIFAGRTMELDSKAFQSCEAKKLVITGCDLIVGENAFSYCEDIEEIYISNSALEIDTYAFYDAGKDMAVQIKNCTGVLDENAFQSCGAASLSITDSNLELGENVFSYCEDVTALTFENSTLEIATYAFYDTGKDMTVSFKDCGLNIEDNAFQSCFAISLNIEGCDTVIGENAFSYCDDLADVKIGANNIEIGTYAFYDCMDLVNVSIAAESDDDSISIVLDNNSFQSCGVQNVVIGKGAVEVGDNAFSYCDNLTSVEFKGSSLEVGSYAFYDCPEELVISYNGSTYNQDSIEDVD